MTSKKVFTIAQHALHNMVKGVFTNKKDLYESIQKLEKVRLVEFKDVLGYERKKFNYLNLLNLLKVLHLDDSFRLRLTLDDDTVKIFEISVKETNHEIQL